MHEVLVLGCGGVGSAALMHLARRGLRVLGFDRFPPAHARGSSHGRTRMIRQAYFEHPDYVPLVLRAYALWAELEAATGRKLYEETGLLEIGPSAAQGGVVVPGVLASARLHSLAVDELSREECLRRFPGFRVPESMVGVFERRAGFLRVEGCVQAHLDEAVRHGAELRCEETVRGWHVEPASAGGASHVVVETERGRYEAARLIITAGAWAGELLAGLGVPLVVRRKPQYWFAPRADDPLADDYRLDRGAPAFLYETPAGVFYGFPVVGPEGLKCAEHSGGRELTNPLENPQAIDPDDLARVAGFLQAHLPGISNVLNDHAPCMYTMSPDENFLVDRHPQHPEVVFAAGLSGHGFKFTSVLGEALADLATTGRSALPIEFLKLNRLGLHGLHGNRVD
ncbi:MAG: N-methyl-L-tryptophan oxidase [Planctomycetia bacterium]|nr:N-methyl-L-tryptophan oxidase [Planctomycetia bacterium]